MEGRRALFLATQSTHLDAFEAVAQSHTFRRTFSAVDLVVSNPGGTVSAEEWASNTYQLNHSSPRGNREGFFTKYRRLLQDKLNAIHWWKSVGRLKDYSVVVCGNDGQGPLKPIGVAAKRAGIPTVVLQDGRLTQAIHPPPELPLKRTLSLILFHIPQLNQFFSSYPGNVADYAAVYGQSTKQAFLNSGASEDKVVITGSPRHQTLKSRYQRHKELESFDQTENRPVRVLFLPSNYRRARLHTYATAQDLLLEWLTDICMGSNASTRPLLLVIKPHPSELEDYEKMRDLGAQLLSPSTDFAYALSQADVVVSLGSTGLVDTLVCHVPAIQVLLREEQSNTRVPSAICVRTKEELASAIMQTGASVERPASIDLDGLRRELEDVDSQWNSVREVAQLLARLTT